MQRFTLIQTSEQAAFLYGLVKEHQPAIVERRSFGFYDGLLMSCAQIDRGGGAILREHPLDYGRGIAQAAIIAPSTHLAWLGTAVIPEPFEPIGTLPSLTYKATLWRPVSLCRVKDPLAIVRLPPVVVPPLPLR
jgi:hypothetical protein